MREVGAADTPMVRFERSEKRASNHGGEMKRANAHLPEG
jgi:hypothetical protein